MSPRAIVDGTTRSNGISRAGAGRGCAADARGKDSGDCHRQREQLYRGRARTGAVTRGKRFRGHVRRFGDRILHAAGDETFEAVKMLHAANPAQYTPAPGASYPNTEFGNNMRQIAQLLKANLGVEAAFTD